MTTSADNFDKISIDELQIRCRIGDTPEEQAFPQIVTLTVDIYFPLEQASRKDQLNATIDYASLITDYEKIAAENRFVLLEAFAGRIAGHTLAQPLARAVTVRASKKVFPTLKAFTVEIHRTKKR